MRSVVLACLLACFLFNGPAAVTAQTRAQPPLVDAEEAAAIAQGWTLLAQRSADAVTRAAQILDKYPRSGAALTLAIEAQIVRGGSGAGLDQYERWLGQRTSEEPAVLRRVALALLRDAALQLTDPAARAEAIQALAAEQDPLAATLTADTSDPALLRVRAMLGDEKAIKTLEKQLQSPRKDIGVIEALGRSGSAAAVAPLVQQLTDPRPEIRGAAADALGRLGDDSAGPRLKSLLSDQSSFVRTHAAAALVRLQDASGVPLLQELMTSDSAPGRLIGVEALAAMPDPSWQQVVRGLTDAAEPEVRIAAARLIAPYDPELAARVLDELSRHENLVIRELASRAQPDAVSRNLTALRRLMRSQDATTRVHAADRILRFTR